MQRSPKQKFLSSPFKSAFDQILTTPAFEEGLHAALLELETRYPFSSTPNEAADAHNQMIGARKFVDILTKLTTPEKEPKPEPWPQLKPTAGV